MAASTLAPPSADYILRRSPIPALRSLRVVETEEEITLSGTVASYYMKQLAQEAIMPVLGLRELRNLVQVIRPRS